MFDTILVSLGYVFTWQSLLFIFLGTSIGIIIGAIPGLNVLMAIAICLPFTFGMNSICGMLLLLGIFCGGTYGGSITAILINTPGTPAAAATTIEGYKLTQKGRSGEALYMALYASVFGGLMSTFALILFAPQLAKVALTFTPAEYFALGIFGLSIIILASGKYVVKGIIMGCLGLLCSTIGLDPIEASTRFTFDQTSLMGGLQLVPFLIGLFAISEVINRSAHILQGKLNLERKDQTNLTLRQVWSKKYMKTLVKSGLIGTVIGAIPGTGSVIASFLSYNESLRSSKHKEEYGQGSLEGVCACETANNGATSSTLIPMLTLGIPGDAVSAVLMGALTVHNLVPGTKLFVDHGDIVYTLMIGLIIINILMGVLGHYACKGFIKVVDLPSHILLPMIVVLCVIGSYAVGNKIVDVQTMMVMGVIGYFLIRANFPLTPLLLGMVLGPIMEQAFRQQMIISKGNWLSFLYRPISFTFIIVAILCICLPLIQRFIAFYKKYRTGKSANN